MALRTRITSVVAFTGPKGSQTEVLRSSEVVPFREEIFTADQVDQPTKLARALHLVQRHVAEATQASRSLPVLGGAYFVDMAFAAGANVIVSHGLTGPVSWIACAVRPSNVAQTASVQEIAQTGSNTRIVFQSANACTIDLWLFPKPRTAT